MQQQEEQMGTAILAAPARPFPAVAVRVAVAVVLAVVATMIMSARPADAATRSDTARYHGAVTSIRASRHGAYLTNITATIQLPRRYANHMRVVVMVQQNGPPAIRDGWWIQKVGHDTNGDARLTYHLGSLKVKRGDRVAVWFSDPVTRYGVTHPELRVR
jgi:hypothetical protein